MDEHDLVSKGFVRQPDGSWRKMPPRSVAKDAVLERNQPDEFLAEDAGKGLEPRRRRVRFTSFRVRLCDERNLCDKHYTDALVRAGILFDDSPDWAEVEVRQEKVEHWHDERIQIDIADA